MIFPFTGDDDSDEDVTPKKTRRVKKDDNVLKYLREKNINELEMRKQELELQRQKLELETKKLENEAADKKMMMDLTKILAGQNKWVTLKPKDNWNMQSEYWNARLALLQNLPINKFFYDTAMTIKLKSKFHVIYAIHFLMNKILL